MPHILLILLIGLLIGILSGMVGLGGGIMVIPVLMFGFGFSQAKANGTSMAMLLPPIGIFAVLSYARAGNIDWTVAALLAAGFAGGAYFGAKLVNQGWINPASLRIAFALLLLYVAARVLFYPGSPARAALETALLLAAFGVPFLLAKLLGRRWEKPMPNPASLYAAKRHTPTEYDYEI